MNKPKIIFLTAFFILASALQAFAGKLTAYDVMKKTFEAVFYAGKDASCDVRMTYLGDEIGSENWIFTILRRNGQQGEQKFLISFKEPFNFMKYMVWKHFDRDDDRWIYIPSLKFFSRIHSKEKRYRFGKFHFTYEDITGRKVEDDHYEFLYSNGTNHYIIKGTPKDRSNLDFSYYYIYVRAEDFIPVKVEFLDEDELVRVD